MVVYVSTEGMLPCVRSEVACVKSRGREQEARFVGLAHGTTSDIGKVATFEKAYAQSCFRKSCLRTERS